jgi:hypothetical protein
MSTPAFNLPVNSVSFGQASTAILREVFKRGLAPNLFPIGQIDLSTQKTDEDFNRRLSAAIETAPRAHSRDDAVIRLWHLSGSLESYSRRDSRLITFFELDGLTPTETNILRQQDKVYVTSSFTQRVFEDHGIQSTYLPLGFDSHNFHQLEKRPLQDGITTFCMGGNL